MGNSSSSESHKIQTDLPIEIPEPENPILFQYQDKHTLSYSSSVQSLSWTTFTHHITNPQILSSLIIIKDIHNYTFGFYASSPWISSPDFYGNNECFLFSLFPNYQIYYPSNLNSNYQYYCSGSKSLINGIGMGGQLDYFGVFFNQDFTGNFCIGDSVSTTFGNPILSKNNPFEISHLEVWTVSEKEFDDRLIQKPKTNNMPQVFGRQQNLEFLEMGGREIQTKRISENPIIQNNPH